MDTHINDRIKSEQAKLLYSHANTGIMGTLLVSAILAYILLDVVSHISIIFWLITLYAVTFVRYLKVLEYKRSTLETDEAQSWINSFVIGLFVSGVVWGSSFIVIFPENSIAHQIFLIFILGGMVSGAVGTFSSSLNALFAFAIPTISPAIVRYLVEGDEIGNAMGLSITIFLALMLVTAKNIHKNILESINLRFEKTDILSSLKVAKDNAEQKSEELQREIESKEIVERELKDAKNIAEDATKLKDKFVSLVAHDLRSPLTSITSLLNLIETDEDIPLSSEYKEIMGRVISNGQNMLKMIDDLLDVSRLQTGSIRPEPTFINGNNVVDVVSASLLGLAEKKGIEVVNEVPPKTRLFADPMLFEQVLQNLLSNAIKFCTKGDKITIFAPAGEASTIAVMDTGVGMSDRMQKVVFSYEEKTSTTGTAGELGTGLGLPLSREIMNVHGGSLYFESEKEKGSTFFARLPFVKPKILIVDDDKSIRDIIRIRLEDLGAECREAVNGKEGVEKIDEDMPHLVLLDLRMPVMDGFDFLVQIRSRPSKRRLPIIVITSESEVDVRDKVFRLGANDFVEKPINVNDLIPRVRRFIA